jgi:large subunit ribosomal protein L20
MPRAKAGVAVAARHRKRRLFKLAEGYWGGRKNLWRIAKQAVLKAQVSSTKDRARRKRDFRRLWITRVRAGANQYGISYSKFIAGLYLAKVGVNRKVLAELAISDPAAFEALVKTAKEALAAKATAAAAEAKN